MIDFSFISKLEGSSLKGYVPDPDGSRSGVTVASGFDIGQRSVDEIKLAFSPELAAKLLPYIGKIKRDADSYLKENPLEISPEEELMINNYSHSSAESKLKHEWLISGAYEEFENLDDICQTVVASVAFQYGSLSARTPNFWKQVTSGDWQAALNNLRNFGDSYSSRRNQEADLLEQWLTNH